MNNFWVQIGANAFLCEALDEYFPSKRDELDGKTLQKLANQVSFQWYIILKYCTCEEVSYNFVFKFYQQQCNKIWFGVLLLHNEIILYCFFLTNRLSDVAVSVDLKCSCLPARLDYIYVFCIS